MTARERDVLTRLREEARSRDVAGLRRTLRPRGAGEDVLDLASNDYLGLARDPRVAAAAAEAARRWGAGSTGSRLVTGSTTLHADLETELALFCGVAAGLVLSSGYLANLAAVTALADAQTLVVSDAGNHASVVDACRLARAEVVVTPHRDVDAVADALARRRQPHAVVVTDAVFSVDGDLAPLAEVHAVARQHEALLVVDEAHSLGVVGPDGRGACADVGIAGADDVVLTATLSKSLGSQGGAVLGPATVVEHLVNTARAFIFDTGLAPAAAGGAAAALAVLRAEPDRPPRARSAAAALSAGLTEAGVEATTPDAAVVAVPVGAADRAVAAAERLRADGVVVGCFRPPSVPDERSRLRLTGHAGLGTDDVRRAVSAVAAAL